MRFQSTTLDSLIRAGSDQADEVPASLSRSADRRSPNHRGRPPPDPSAAGATAIEPATSGVRGRYGLSDLPEPGSLTEATLRAVLDLLGQCNRRR